MIIKSTKYEDQNESLKHNFCFLYVQLTFTCFRVVQNIPYYTHLWIWIKKIFDQIDNSASLNSPLGGWGEHCTVCSFAKTGSWKTLRQSTTGRATSLPLCHSTNTDTNTTTNTDTDTDTDTNTNINTNTNTDTNTNSGWIPSLGLYRTGRKEKVFPKCSIFSVRWLQNDAVIFSRKL